MAVPNKRKLSVGTEISIWTETSTPGGSVALEEYTEKTSATDEIVSNFHNSGESTVLLKNEYPAGSEGDVWASTWNENVTFNTCDLKFSTDFPASGEGKTFTGAIKVDVDGTSAHMIPLSDLTGNVRFVFVKGISGETLINCKLTDFVYYNYNVNAGEFACIPLYDDHSIRPFDVTFKYRTSPSVIEYLIGIKP
jgi:hypothetical protein